MEDILLMSRKERDRSKVLERVKAKTISIKEAAHLLHISYRHCHRIYIRFLLLGDKGLVHSSRGKPSNRALASHTVKAILDRYKSRYPDFGPTLASEEIAKEGLLIDHETLRRLIAPGESAARISES